MDMNRRNVLIGVGAAAVGSGIVFGSGAFTQVSADRDITIQVDDDSQALLELNANGDLDSVFDDNGQLTIDSNELSGNAEAEGFNNNAWVEIGGTDEDAFGEGDVTDEAFEVRNNFDQEIDVTFDVGAVQPEDDGELELAVTKADETSRFSDTSTFTVSSGDNLLVALEFDTENDPADGEITLTAEPTA